MRGPLAVRLVVAATAIAAVVLLVTEFRRLGRPAAPITGFAASALDAERDAEEQLTGALSRARIESDHRFLTAEPHVAGTPRDRALADWVRTQWEAEGLDSVELVEHEVLLPYPRQVSVDVLAPTRWSLSLYDDTPTNGRHPAGPAFHAYGADGDVTADVVYVGDGSPASYDWLSARGIDVRGRVVLARSPTAYSYRGFVVYTAQQRGASAVLLFSSPSMSAVNRDPGIETRIERGGVGFDFLAPGDPLTPGWPSTPDARRLDRAAARTLPTIASVPIAYRDAARILESMPGVDAPQSWRPPALASARVGPGPRVHVVVHNDEATRPIWTIVGRINGADDPDHVVVVGNHRDAWTYGGVDPSSGSAVLMDVVRGFGALLRAGIRPKRSIVFASWDAEEYALTSSTEWGEEHEVDLRDSAVAYLNADAAVAGQTLALKAVPPLAGFVAELTGTEVRTIDTRIGAGSDYNVFLDFLGIPIADFRFEGPYEAYHTSRDDHEWVSRVADPGFLVHARLARLWSVAALRLANAELLPYDTRAYAQAMRSYLTDIRGRWSGTGEPPLLADAGAALSRFEAAAAAFHVRASSALQAGDAPTLQRLNESLRRVESSLVDPRGLPGRQWYRHVVYAPAYTYEPEVLPGLAEALVAGDLDRLADQERRFVSALDRATRVLSP